MSSFVIKLIAMFAMLCDHASDAIIGHFNFLNLIGRISFPLFTFQLVIGFKNTSNVKKYLTRMFVFAIISQLPFQILIKNYSGEFLLNIFFTLILGLISLMIVNKCFCKNGVINTIIKIALVVGICSLASLSKCDYGAIGILEILLIYYTYPCDWKKKTNNINVIKLILLISGEVVLSAINYIDVLKLHLIGYYIGIIIATTIPIFIMLAYNGQKGKEPKYLFYSFYPIHLIILDIIHFFLSN